MLAKTLSTLALCTCASLACAQPFAFGLWGDMPYKKAGDDSKMPALLKSINQSNIAFSIYDGDIKDGSSQCTDEVYEQALTMFNSLRKPLVYVPGDNEWTDCHRTNNGGYDALERLEHLRKVMFPTTASLGQKTLPMVRQGGLGQKFVENSRFTYGKITFVALNVPGSNNNRILTDKECTNKSARTPAQCEAANAESAERDTANISWLRSAFAEAQQKKSRGIVVVIQADPGFDLPETEDSDESQEPRFSGYRSFISTLVSETEQFAGQVLLVHGDTHFFKVDKPLYSPTKLLPNLTRLQTFGSPALHWVRVSVNPSNKNVFSIEPVIVQQP